MEKKELRLWTAFGTSLKDALLVASHPDEEGGPNDDLTYSRRFLLRLQGNQAVIDGVTNEPIAGAWASTSGAAYCALCESGSVSILENGKWTSERFSDSAEEVNRVFGISGKTPKDDVVFVTARGAVFIRRAGGWARFDNPDGRGHIVGVHGLTADEVYLCSEDESLLQWDGKALTPMERPEGMPPKGVWVVSDDELWLAGRNLDRWTSAGGWERYPHEFNNIIELAGLGGEVFGAAPKFGVVRVAPGNVALVSEPFSCIRLRSLRDGIIGIGYLYCDDPPGAVYDGAVWKTIAMPRLAKGENP